MGDCSGGWCVEGFGVGGLRHCQSRFPGSCSLTDPHGDSSATSRVSLTLSCRSPEIWNVTLAFYPLCLYTASFIHVLLHSDAYSLFLIVRGDINFLWARLFSRQSPPVYVMRSFLLLLRLRALLLQLLSLKLRSPVLKPHFYLKQDKKRKEREKNWISVTR